MAAIETRKPITEEQQQELDDGVRAREEGARDHRGLRPGARRSAVPGGGLGGREQADVHASRRHGNRRERSRRPGEPDGQADEDPRRAA